MTDPTVKWIFARHLSGVSVAGIARELNERDVPCPSRVDPGRNPHRSDEGWVLNTVATILANPRYTGREAWNRHSASDRGEPGEWAVSVRLAHLGLVSDADFVAVQNVRAARSTAMGLSEPICWPGC